MANTLKLYFTTSGNSYELEELTDSVVEDEFAFSCENDQDQATIVQEFQTFIAPGNLTAGARFITNCSECIAIKKTVKSTTLWEQ